MIGDDQNLPERQELKGTAISKRFSKAIYDKGGNERAQARANGAVARGVMGCTLKELYETTEGKPKVVASLPEAAQEGLAVGKIAATHALNASEDFQGNQAQINQQIADTSYEAAKGASKLFPWNW